MDPVSLIVAAVVAGASAGVTDAVKDDVKRAYAALRRMLVERFTGNSAVQTSIDLLEARPGSATAKATLTEQLGKAHVEEDDELVTLAEAVSGSTGLDVRQFIELARGATVLRSGTVIDGLASGTVTSTITAAEDSRVEDSGVRITYGPPQV